MAKLKVISWNVRNLTNMMVRPGEQGHGLTLVKRIENVALNIKQWQPDLLFIMESGKDGASVAATLETKLTDAGYKTLATPLTKDETYIIVWRQELSPGVSPEFVIEELEDPPKFRGALHLSLLLEGCHIAFIVLHAPAKSTKQNLATRLGYIHALLQKIINSAAFKNKKYDLVCFLGDLNFTKTEFGQLKTNLNEFDFKFVGPVVPDEPDTPANTSIVKFYTQLRKQGLTIPDSQPYDQFWLKNQSKNPQINPTSSVQLITNLQYSAPVYDSLKEYINNRMKQVQALVKSHKDGRRDHGRIEKMVEEQTYHELEWIIALHASLLTNKGYPDDWKTTFNLAAVYLADKELLEKTDQIYNVKKRDSTLTLYQQRTVADIVSRLFFAQYLGHNFLNIDPKIPKMANLAVYEYSISDHLPIELILDTKTNDARGKDKRKRADVAPPDKQTKKTKKG